MHVMPPPEDIVSSTTGLKAFSTEMSPECISDPVLDTSQKSINSGPTSSSQKGRFRNQRFRKGVGGQRGGIPPIPYIQAFVLYPFSYAPLMKRRHNIGDKFSCIWGAVRRQPPPANPFRNL